MSIYFYDIPAYSKRIEFLPLATADIAHFCSQLNYAFALLISMQRFEKFNFFKIGLKLQTSNFHKKKLRNFSSA